jgi:hypothetical protein
MVSSASGPVLMFCAPKPIFCGTDGVGTRFLVLHSRTHFGRYRWRRVSFSCFALHDSFSAVPRVSGPVFFFCAPRPIFDGTNDVRSCFHVLRSRTHFRRYRGRRVPFLCFALPDPFSAVPAASGPVFMFCAPGLGFRRYRGRRVLFSNFVLSDPYTVVSSAPGSVLMFCAPKPIFSVINGVGSHFHVLRPRTLFRRYRGRRVPFSCFAHPDYF